MASYSFCRKQRHGEQESISAGEAENSSPIESLYNWNYRRCLRILKFRAVPSARSPANTVRETSVGIETQTVVLLPQEGLLWQFLAVTPLLGHARTVLFTLSGLLEPVMWIPPNACASVVALSFRIASHPVELSHTRSEGPHVPIALTLERTGPGGPLLLGEGDGALIRGFG